MQLIKWKAHAVTAGPRRDLDDLNTWKYLLALSKEYGVDNSRFLTVMCLRMAHPSAPGLALAMARDIGVEATLRRCYKAGSGTPDSEKILGGVCEHLGPYITNNDLAACWDFLSRYSYERWYPKLYGWWPRIKRVFKHKALPRTSANGIDHWLTGEFGV